MCVCDTANYDIGMPISDYLLYDVKYHSQKTENYYNSLYCARIKFHGYLKAS